MRHEVRATLLRELCVYQHFETFLMKLYNINSHFCFSSRSVSFLPSSFWVCLYRLLSCRLKPDASIVLFLFWVSGSSGDTEHGLIFVCCLIPLLETERHYSLSYYNGILSVLLIIYTEMMLIIVIFVTDNFPVCF